MHLYSFLNLRNMMKEHAFYSVETRGGVSDSASDDVRIDLAIRRSSEDCTTLR